MNVAQNVLGNTAPASEKQVVLSVRNLESYYGPIMAIRGCSLEVREGQIVTVLGANGAGKTTLMKTISGVMDPEKGQIFYGGQKTSQVQRPTRWCGWASCTCLKDVRSSRC